MDTPSTDPIEAPDQAPDDEAAPLPDDEADERPDHTSRPAHDPLLNDLEAAIDAEERLGRP